MAAPPGGTLSNGNRTLSVPLADVASLRVDAAGGSDVLTVDYRQPSEFFALAGGIEFVGGAGGNSDELVVQGSGVFAQLSSDTGQLSDLIVDTFVGASHTVISSSGIESASVLDMTDLDVQGLLAVGAGTLRLDTQGYANLDGLTTIAGGTISGAVALSAGDEISGHGTVSGTVFAGEGSRITASGDLVLGLAGSSNGFRSDGLLVAIQHTVTLNDSNEAILGDLTLIGAGSSVGTLVAQNGILLSEGSRSARPGND